MNTFDEMAVAVEDAKRTLQVADRFVTAMAGMLIGRLRKVQSWHALCELKKELRDFNMTTGEWK